MMEHAVGEHRVAHLAHVGLRVPRGHEVLAGGCRRGGDVLEVRVGTVAAPPGAEVAPAVAFDLARAVIADIVDEHTPPAARCRFQAAVHRACLPEDAGAHRVHVGAIPAFLLLLVDDGGPRVDPPFRCEKPFRGGRVDERAERTVGEVLLYFRRRVCLHVEHMAVRLLRVRSDPIAGLAARGRITPLHGHP